MKSKITKIIVVSLLLEAILLAFSYFIAYGYFVPLFQTNQGIALLVCLFLWQLVGFVVMLKSDEISMQKLFFVVLLFIIPVFVLPVVFPALCTIFLAVSNLAGET